MTVADKWLLLLYGLPARKNAARVNLWRQLRKCGALPFKTSAYLLPDQPEHFERLQWLAQQVREEGGDATIIRVSEIEGLQHRDVVHLFNEARATDYVGLTTAINELVRGRKKLVDEAFTLELARLTRQFEDIRKIDFFACAQASEVLRWLQQAAQKTMVKPVKFKRLAPKQFIGRTWLTRPRPGIDRAGSAWLIRKFIDPQARFIFGNDPQARPEAIPYDMYEGDFSHHGEDCTFETLVKWFRITDRAVMKIACMVHDADLEDGKFQMAECIGIDRILQGWAKSGLSDAELLQRGGECFEALYQQLSK